MIQVGRTDVTILLSGGIDSAVVAALLTHEGRHASALFIDYGQPAIEAERRSSRAVAEYYQLPCRELAIEGMKIPAVGEIVGRNDLLIAAASAVATSGHVAIGTHAGTGYLDSSPEHASAWQRLLDVQSSGRRRLLAPLIDLTKSEVYSLGEEVGVPFELTHSCERTPSPCNRCRSCADRLMIHVTQ